MRGKLILLFFILAVIVTISAQINTITGNSITGEAVTGKATQGVNLNITVTGSTLASITIIKPENNTYLQKDSLPLDFIVSNQQAIWYNLDNGNNMTIIAPILFNSSQGSHTLYLFANNSMGNLTSKNITFIINISIFTLNYSNYNGSHKGSSTDFYNLSQEELENLSNCTFENTNFGKIFFNVPLNLTDSSGNTIDFNRYINISTNWIEINTSTLPNLNASATLTLSNLSYSNPRIVINDIVCPNTICVKQSYSNGVLVFNVSHFTSFSAEETPVSSSPSESSSSSSGGGSTTNTQDAAINRINFNKEIIKISLKQKETKKESLIIKNTGTKTINLNLIFQNIDEFIKTSDKSFSLAPEEEKEIFFEFSGKEDKSPDIYTGKILIKGEGIEKSIPIIFELESKNPLFDVLITIPKENRFISSGKDLPFNVKILELEKLERGDVELEYIIKNDQGTTIALNQETIAVEKQADFIRTIYIPEGTKEGDYYLYVK
ncbi:MAG: hypothetical protein AABY22_04195 [Nanoarchaeota archaeon]